MSFGDLIAVLYLLAFLLCGLALAALLLPREDRLTQMLMGAALGLFLLMWLPALFAFFLGFTLPAQVAALLVALLPPLALFALRLAAKRNRLPFALPPAPVKTGLRAVRVFWLCVGPTLLLAAYLLYTHVLQPQEGALHTGQSCYGDMAMHLSFITSLARDGVFPPSYPIQAGSAMGYPFLCDSVSSTFLVLGASLRLSYILPMLPALLCVCGMYFLLMRRFLGSTGKAALAYALFFLGGGFGFAYFLNGALAEPSNFTRIFTAFYETPTNYVAENVCWVNPLADLLIPQRATLFGWSVLLPCLYLLYRAAFEEQQRRSFVLLGVLAGGLPLLHTHSFLALGLISASVALYRNWRAPRQLGPYLLYAGIALALALPQLIGFTFAQASQEGFLRFHLNWFNQQDPYLWFYIKNIGVVFLLLPFALLAERRLRPFWLCALPIWILCEFIVFQPNAYDNNKLLYVVHMLSCGVVASYLFTLYRKLDGLPGRRLLSAAVLAAAMFSGVLTLGREVVSDYELFSAEQVRAASFAAGALPKDAVLLTADEHNNAFASLGGLTIVQGSPSYLYFHGVYDTQRALDVQRMYTEPGALETLAPRYGVTHVVLSDYERAMGADENLFAALPVLYQEGRTTIYTLAYGLPPVKGV